MDYHELMAKLTETGEPLILRGSEVHEAFPGHSRLRDINPEAYIEVSAKPLNDPHGFYQIELCFRPVFKVPWGFDPV